MARHNFVWYVFHTSLVINILCYHHHFMLVKIHTYHLIDFYQVWSVLRFFWSVPVLVLGFRFHLALGTSFQVEAQLCRSPTFLPNWLLASLVFKLIRTISIVVYMRRWNLPNCRYFLNWKQENKSQETATRFRQSYKY